MGANNVNDYQPLRDEVMLKLCKIQPERKSLIVKPEETEAMELASTRWRIVKLGPKADEMLAVGDMVLVSGRVWKVFCKNILAPYLTVTWVGDEAFWIVPSDDIDCRIDGEVEPEHIELPQ